MPEIAFNGFVFSRDRNTTFHDLPKMVLTVPEFGLNVNFAMEIQNGNLAVRCTLNRALQGNELIRLYIRVHDIVQATLDVVSFATGRGFTLLLNEYTNTDGITSELAIENPDLGELCTAFTLDKVDFKETLLLVLSEPYLYWALRDLIAANTLPNHSAIECARVVDALRVMIAGNKVPRAQGWEKLQKTLRLSPEYLKAITEVSKASRHGDRTPVLGEITMDVTRRTWTVMDRYIAYRKRGFQPLPEAEFPVL